MRCVVIWRQKNSYEMIALHPNPIAPQGIGGSQVGALA